MSGRSIRSELQSALNKLQKAGFILILFVFLQAACSSNTDQRSPSQPTSPPPADRVETLSYEVRTIEKKDPNCIQTAAQCTYIRFVYPEVAGGPARAKDAINKAVSNFLLQGAEEGQQFDTIDKAMDSFIANYQKFKNDFQMRLTTTRMTRKSKSRISRLKS